MDLQSFSVSARWASVLLLPAAIVASAPALSAQSEEDDTYMGENPDRYASVRALDGEATIRKGDAEEALSRGVPIAEGDVVESHGRGVLQLADGTRIAFGSDTRFQVATLFTDKDEDQQVLLRLDHGRLRVAVGRESEAQVRIDTPSGSALLSNGSSASIEMERDRTARVKVHSGRMVFQNERDKASLLAGERLTVYSDQDRLDRIQDFNTYGGDAFDSWSDRQLTVHHGASWEKVPTEIRQYADDLDDNGEWVYVDEYRTWCWRPLRVSAEWRPYWRGRWGAYPGGMTWISDEPWGYVTYHHGRWGWGAGLGWYWIPGIYYSPAWVAWQTSDVYFGWAPIGYHNHPVSWGYGAWGGGYCWNVVEINFIHSHDIHTHTHRDPGVIRHFNPGSGSTGWNDSPGGNRPLTHPWRQSPLVVSQNEFRNPAQLQRVVQEPRTMQNRLRTYEQQAGRTIYRRPLSDVRTVSPGAVDFEDRSHLKARPLSGPPRSISQPPPMNRTPSAPSQPITRQQQGPSDSVPPPPGHRPSQRPAQPITRQQQGPSGSVPPPPVQRPTQPITRQQQGPSNPVPPVQRPSPPIPREQPVQPRQQAPSSGSEPPPPIWLKKKRPLDRP